jgi:hypothetical protein
MRVNVWYGDDKQAAKFVVTHTALGHHDTRIRKIYTSRGYFFRNPDAIQRMLYLDRPDIVITTGDPEVPILAVEFCAEAPTGHDITQRMARVAAAAEFQIPLAYMFPERKWITRRGGGRWDEYNPLPLYAMLQIGRFHQCPVPALFWEASDEAISQGRLCCDAAFPGVALPEPQREDTQALFRFIDLALAYAQERRHFSEMAFDPSVMARERWMWERFSARAGTLESMSPLSAAKEVSTRTLATALSRKGLPVALAAHIRARPRTLICSTKVTTFRSDPYAGNLVAMDYAKCRVGPTVRHRHVNLAIEFSELPFALARDKFRNFHARKCPFRAGYDKADPYLTLHLRDGCRYTKQKELRIFCFYADLVIFQDAVLHT